MLSDVVLILILGGGLSWLSQRLRFSQRRRAGFARRVIGNSALVLTTIVVSVLGPMLMLPLAKRLRAEMTAGVAR